MKVAENYQKLNPEQRSAFDTIVESALNHQSKLFFLNGPAGTGKTYVYNVVCSKLRAEGQIVLCVASSGIAALLLPGGRTSHSHFKIPLQTNDTSFCNFSKNSMMADLIRETSVII
jgi:chromosomal replication initiation ATPase DnaA